jgi:hypothetical protein
MPAASSSQRRRLVAHADEPGDAWCIANQIPGVVRHRHFDQHIAGEDFALHRAALAVADLDFFLGGHHDAENLIAQIVRRDPIFQVLLNFILVAGVRVNHVPLTIVLFVLALGLDLIAHRQFCPCIHNARNYSQPPAFP